MILKKIKSMINKKKILIHVFFDSIKNEYFAIYKTLRFWESINYLFIFLFKFKRVLRDGGRCLSIDREISKKIKDINIKMLKKNIYLPYAQVENLLDMNKCNDGASLELVREIYGNNVYLRNFKKTLNAHITIDIGSNRGFFLLVASKILKAKKIIRVEPQENLMSVAKLLCEKNNISKKALINYSKMIKSKNNGSSEISINKIIEENSINSIDFLKMDVEGDEAEIFSDNLQWLMLCKNLAMEIHFFGKNVYYIPLLLKKYGFKIMTTTPQNKKINDLESFNASDTAYVYASKNNQLIV